MSTLPDPIRDAIDLRVEEPEVAAGWRRVQHARETAAPRPFARAGLVLSMAAAAVLLVWWLAPSASPLAPRDGGTLATMQTASSERRVELSDGSSITLGSDSRLRVLENRPDRLLLLLERGSARFDVEPGTERGWRIEAGFASVEVTGTVFTIDRTERRVSVERGRVIVRSDDIPHGVRVLSAGGAVVVPVDPPAVTAETTPEETTPEATPPHETPASEAPTPEPAAPEVEPATEPDVVRPATPTREAERPAAPTPEDLLSRADEARAAGRTAEGLDFLARAGRGQGQTASVALVTRGRWLLELDRPAEAARDLERAHRLSAPASMRELVLSSLVQAHVRRGDRPAAERSAAEYLRRYPSGSFREQNERWLARLPQ